jgi:hypothetical protein
LKGLVVTKITRWVYVFAAWLFVVGVVIQVFLAGMVVVALRMGWGNHTSLGHGLAFPLLVLLVTMYFGRLPGSMKWLTWLLFGVYILQADVVIFLRFQAPVISAVHPVLALVDFALGLSLAQRAWPLVRPGHPPASVQPDLESPPAN